MFHAGIEPAGVAGGFACIETLASKSTVVAGTRWTRRIPNIELEDDTTSVYEARRLALERLLGDAKALSADGLLGSSWSLRGVGSARVRLSGLVLTVHVIASAVRRVGRAPVRLAPVLTMSDRACG